MICIFTRDGNEASVNQGETTRSRKRQRSFLPQKLQREQGLPAPDFRLPAFRTVGEYISVDLSHLVCVPLSRESRNEFRHRDDRAESCLQEAQNLVLRCPRQGDQRGLLSECLQPPGLPAEGPFLKSGTEAACRFTDTFSRVSRVWGLIFLM